MKDYTKNKSPEMLEPFFPNEFFRHSIVSCFLIVAELLAVIFFPLPGKLVNKPDHIPWFLLPLYKLNKLIHNEVLFISLVVMCALLFVSWPFLANGRKPGEMQNTGTGRSWRVKEHYGLLQRPISCIVVVVTILFVIALCFVNP